MIQMILHAAKAIAQPGFAAVPLNHEILARWESLTLDDAGVGDFVTLTNGAQMHYVTLGPLTPVDQVRDIVLLHGFMDSAYNWKVNLHALAQKHRVWALDLPGFGFSSRFTERVYTFKNFARWVRDFMNIVKVQRACVVGHSMGGAITLQLAHDYPQRVDKIVLLNPAAYWWIPAPVRFAARIPWLPRAIVTLAIHSKRVHSTIWRLAVRHSTFNADEIARRTRHHRVKGTLDALIALTGSPRESDLPRGLSNISAPSLVVWGAEDQVFPAEHGERLARDLPHAELLVIPEVGHIPNQECSQVIDEAILNFLKES
jgi:pimeloyl-ACP methyl ester carboxylesterase